MGRGLFLCLFVCQHEARNLNEFKTVLVKNTATKHPDKKPLALDGRSARGRVPFFEIRRTDDPNEANMELVYPKVETTTTIEFQGTFIPKKKRKWDVYTEAHQNLQVPVLINTVKLNPETELVAKHDVDLQKILKVAKNDAKKQTNEQ